MFSILEQLASNNGLNDKGQEDYSLFSLVTPYNHESCPTTTTCPYKLKLQYLLLCEYKFTTTLLHCFNDILLTVALTEINIVYRLAQLSQGQTAVQQNNLFPRRWNQISTTIINIIIKCELIIY